MDAERTQLAANEQRKEDFDAAHAIDLECYVSNKPTPEASVKLLRTEFKFSQDVKVWEEFCRERAWMYTMARCKQDAELRAAFEADLRCGDTLDPEYEEYLRLPERERHRWPRRYENDEDEMNNPPEEATADSNQPKAHGLF